MKRQPRAADTVSHVAPNPGTTQSPDGVPPRSPADLVFECELREPPPTVWKALTDSQLLAKWLLPNDFRPEAGRRFTFSSLESIEGVPASRIDCEVLEIEPNRLLRYSWRNGEIERDAAGQPLDSTVTFELFPTITGGTFLRLIHGGFPPLMQTSQALRAFSALRSTTRDPKRLAFSPASSRRGMAPNLRWAA